MATWARGVDFKNSTNTTRVGGIGIYGTDTTTNKLYIGLGAEPWNNAGLQLTSSAINFKGNKIYHAGDKPTASEIGAAAASHSHNYLPLSGGAVTSSNFGPLVIKRSGSTNASTIVFSNDNGTLGSIGMTASKNGGLIRWTDDTASSYTILDTGNYKSFVTPASIGAAAASHNHDVLISAGGRIASADIAAKGDRGLRMYLATQSMTTGKPASDGFILNFDWDTTAGWSSQMYIKNSNSPIMQIRGMNAGTWGSWYTLYSTNNKPTPAEIGAAASSHTHSYIPLSGSTGVTGTLRSNSEIQTTSLNAFRAVGGNYGFFIRNDGANTWFLLTNSGNQYGSYNSLRPLSINNSTGVVTFGNGLKGTLDGNASTATTLQNARTINDVNFNGSSNITIPLKTFVSNVGNDNTKNYHRILSSGVVTGSYADKTIILMGSGNYSGGPFGIVKIILRTNASGSNSNCNIDWMVRKGFGLDSIVCNMINTYGSTVADIFYKCAGAYAAINWTVLFENNGRGGSYNNGSWTKYSTNASGTEAYTETEMKALRSYTSTLAQGSDTTVVNSANKLASRRTLTIGSTGKSFDGTSNVSWSLSEIGAASSSHTHNYAAAKSAGGGALEVIPVQDTANKVYLTGILDFNSAKIRASTPYMAGGTITATTFVGALNGNATTATTLATARTINGTSFNGSANITTANWGTARTITVGSTSKSVNGSANIGWTLTEIGAVPSYSGSSTTIHADSDASSTSEYLLLKAGHNELKIASSAGGTTVTKGQDKLTFNGNIVYHAGRKPTASEIGAVAFDYSGEHSNNTHPRIFVPGKEWLRAPSGGFVPFKHQNGYLGLANKAWYDLHTVHINSKPIGGFDGRWWDIMPVVTPDGVVEVGRVIDFHDAKTHVGDYTYRLHADGGTLYHSGVLAQMSDKSLKENIQYIDDRPALLSEGNDSPTPFKDFIKEFKFATFNYVDDKNKDTNFGFIAQDIKDSEVGKLMLRNYKKENIDKKTSTVKSIDDVLAFDISSYITIVGKALQEEIKVRDEEITELKRELREIKEKIGI